MYRLRTSSRAQKDLDALPPDAWARVCAAIDGLRVEPRPRGCIKLRGGANTFRIRVGIYRIIYDVHDDDSLVFVLRVKHRRDAYRGF